MTVFRARCDVELGRNEPRAVEEGLVAGMTAPNSVLDSTLEKINGTTVRWCAVLRVPSRRYLIMKHFKHYIFSFFNNTHRINDNILVFNEFLPIFWIGKGEKVW